MKGDDLKLCRTEHHSCTCSFPHRGCWSGECDLWFAACLCLCFAGRPYRHAVWLPAAAIEAKRPSLLRNFLSRHAGGDAETDWADTNNINPAWYKVRLQQRCGSLLCTVHAPNSACPVNPAVGLQDGLAAKVMSSCNSSGAH